MSYRTMKEAGAAIRYYEQRGWDWTWAVAYILIGRKAASRGRR